MKIIHNSWPGKWIKRFGPSSCEMIAETILKQLNEKYGEYRDWKVSVFEDDIQGGIIEH
jgi:hypothetical protein